MITIMNVMCSDYYYGTGLQTRLVAMSVKTGGSKEERERKKEKSFSWNNKALYSTFIQRF